VNATQVGDAIKAILLAFGVSSTVVGYITAEMWAAIGGFVLALGSFIWMLIAHKTEKLIVAVADDPAVAHVVMKDPKKAQDIPSNKVISIRRESL